jgi:putative SOS response-associated peptidase YedK
LILFAGLYEYWPSGPDQFERTFTIVTTDANEVVGRVHDRMPVILEEERADAWMLPKQNADRLSELLVPASDDLLVATSVSPRANSVKNDDPAVLEEVASRDLP